MKKEINITVTVDIPEGNALLSQQVLDDLNSSIRAAKEQQSKLSLSEGYMVVDTTWKRTLHYLKYRWLGTSSVDYPITVFDTIAEAEEAITNTVEHEGGNRYEWQNNKYIVIGVNKDSRPPCEKYIE